MRTNIVISIETNFVSVMSDIYQVLLLTWAGEDMRTQLLMRGQACCK